MLVALNLKDEETVALVSELAKRLGRSKTAVVRDLAREKLAALDAENSDEVERRAQELWQFMEREIWPKVPPGPPMTKAEREELLGYNEMFPDQ